MVHSFDPGALLSQLYVLPGDVKVRLRLTQRRDERAIRTLLSRRVGGQPDEFEVLRVMRFDPQRLAICATTLLAGVETLVGVGTIRLDPPRPHESPEPELLLVDERIGHSLEQLLRGALCGRAEAIARDRAA